MRIRALCTPVPEQQWQFGDSDSRDKLILPQIAWNYIRAGVYCWKSFPWKAKRCSQEGRPAQALSCPPGPLLFTGSKMNSQITHCSSKQLEPSCTTQSCLNSDSMEPVRRKKRFFKEQRKAILNQYLTFIAALSPNVTGTSGEGAWEHPAGNKGHIHCEVAPKSPPFCWNSRLPCG